MKKNRVESAMKGVYFGCAFLAVLFLVMICYFIFVEGIAPISKMGWKAFLLGRRWLPSAGFYGIYPMIITSIVLTLGAIVMGVPLGILTAVYLVFYCPKKRYGYLKGAIDLLAGIPSVVYGFFGLVMIVPAMRWMIGSSGKTVLTAAIYLVEYARPGSYFVKMIRLTSQSLSGIPSIVYGLFGYLLFVIRMKLSYSLLGGALTLAIMVLPLMMRTTEEAMMAVPDSFLEASFGLGAGKTRTIYRIVLPAARSGIVSGVVLSVGRIVGETAALLYTAGSVTGLIKSLTSPGRTLAVHMYALQSEGLHMEEAYATAVVLLVLVFIINHYSAKIIGVKKDGKV